MVYGVVGVLGFWSETFEGASPIQAQEYQAFQDQGAESQDQAGIFACNRNRLFRVVPRSSAQH